MPIEDIYNFLKVDERTFTGGQPTEDQLQSAAETGNQVVINLAPYHPGESLPNEAETVQSLGMEYHGIPVDWENPTRQDFDLFESAMQQVGQKKVLVHCAANFRATVFYSLYAQRHLGWSQVQGEKFRSLIWQGSDYPAWNRLILEIQSQGN
jgi:uncharacterized protein (TIGR01244 family)